MLESLSHSPVWSFRYLWMTPLHLWANYSERRTQIYGLRMKNRFSSCTKSLQHTKSGRSINFAAPLKVDVPVSQHAQCNWNAVIFKVKACTCILYVEMSTRESCGLEPPANKIWLIAFAEVWTGFSLWKPHLALKKPHKTAINRAPFCVTDIFVTFCCVVTKQKSHYTMMGEKATLSKPD